MLGVVLRITSAAEVPMVPADIAADMIRSLLPPSSAKCTPEDGEAGGIFTSSFNFSASPVGTWDSSAVEWEDKVFAAELKHTDPNPNRSWALKIGSGGNVYSFVTALGETVPPQVTRGSCCSAFFSRHQTLAPFEPLCPVISQAPDDAPFVDEVWQAVAVATALNAPDDPFYIHQAGTYFNRRYSSDRLLCILS